MKNQKPNNQVHIESKSLTSRAQLIDVLSVFGTIGQFLVRANSDDFSQHTGGKLDGGVKGAIEATMINVCNRLDSILADESRWTLQDRDTLEKKMMKSFEASADLFEKQRALAKEANTPHHKYLPALIRIRPGLWMAIKGSLENIDAGIVGLGESPQAALDCFDACFEGKLSQEQINYIQNLNDELQKMVKRRTGNTQNPPSGENANPGDSPKTEQKPSVSGEGGPNPPDSYGPTGSPGLEGYDPGDPDDPYADPGNAPTGCGD